MNGVNFKELNLMDATHYEGSPFKDDHTTHLEIEKYLKSSYLCLIDKNFYCGKFFMQWYGLNFMPNLCITAGFQFNMPGENGSKWERIWRIVEDEYYF